MKMKIPMKGDECDVFTNWRHKLKFTARAGVCKRVKQGYNRRLRKVAKAELRNES